MVGYSCAQCGEPILVPDQREARLEFIASCPLDCRYRELCQYRTLRRLCPSCRVAPYRYDWLKEEFQSMPIRKQPSRWRKMRKDVRRDVLDLGPEATFAKWQVQGMTRRVFGQLARGMLKTVPATEGRVVFCPRCRKVLISTGVMFSHCRRQFISQDHLLLTIPIAVQLDQVVTRFSNLVEEMRDGRSHDDGAGAVRRRAGDVQAV